MPDKNINPKKLDIGAGSWYNILIIEMEIEMITLSELKKHDAILRMSRFSTKRKGNDKKRLSKKACRGKVRF